MPHCGTARTRSPGPSCGSRPPPLAAPLARQPAARQASSQRPEAAGTPPAAGAGAYGVSPAVRPPCGRATRRPRSRPRSQAPGRPLTMVVARATVVSCSVPVHNATCRVGGQATHKIPSFLICAWPLLRYTLQSRHHRPTLLHPTAQPTPLSLLKPHSVPHAHVGNPWRPQLRCPSRTATAAPGRCSMPHSLIRCRHSSRCPALGRAARRCVCPVSCASHY